MSRRPSPRTGRRTVTVGAIALAATVLSASPAAACGGLIGARGSVQLLRTTTFAGYSQGVEHYVTSFSFVGAGGAFGSITPLPGVPTEVEKGGEWTLQRLIRETTPQPEALSAVALDAGGSGRSAKVLIDVDIDSLDVTVLEGGADEVGVWAKENGFALPPDAPEVLDFYAQRSPIFMAVRFDAARAAAQGLQQGDGTPIHLTIPTPNPWVPLRILGLGKQANEIVEADVYLLTDRKPALLPAPRNGLDLVYDTTASASLLDDLRSDKGMGWVPEQGYLSKLEISTEAGELKHDLAIDASGQGAPSLVAAGLTIPATLTGDDSASTLAVGLLVIVGLVLIGVIVVAGPMSSRLPTTPVD